LVDLEFVLGGGKHLFRDLLWKDSSYFLCLVLTVDLAWRKGKRESGNFRFAKFTVLEGVINRSVLSI
jgi:hypothetical protein